MTDVTNKGKQKSISLSSEGFWKSFNTSKTIDKKSNESEQHPDNEKEHLSPSPTSPSSSSSSSSPFSSILQLNGNNAARASRSEPIKYSSDGKLTETQPMSKVQPTIPFSEHMILPHTNELSHIQSHSLHPSYQLVSSHNVSNQIRLLQPYQLHPQTNAPTTTATNVALGTVPLANTSGGLCFQNSQQEQPAFHHAIGSTSPIDTHYILPSGNAPRAPSHFSDLEVLGHKRKESQTSSDHHPSDLWVPNTIFNFIPKSPIESISQIPTLALAGTHPAKRNRSGETIITDASAAQQQIHRNPFSLGNFSLSSERNPTTEEVKKHYLDYYANSSHLLKGLMNFDGISENIQRFITFLKYDEQMRKFMDMERQKDISGVLDPQTYVIEEFYKYLRQFPKQELIDLKSIFHSADLIMEDWLNLEEEEERVQIPLSNWMSSTGQSVNMGGNGGINLEETLGFHHHNLTEISNVRNPVLPFSKWNKSSNLPGETVSLQVEPLKPKDFNETNELYPKGKLQPELSFRMRTVCQQCGSDKTPEWRRGPKNAKTLCNACGLFYNKLVKKYGQMEALGELERRRVAGDSNNRKLYVQTKNTK